MRTSEFTVTDYRSTLTLLSRELLDGLKRVGFRTNMGYKDAGFLLLAWERAGGYYLGKFSTNKIASSMS